jgi:hypothetical protein
MRSWALQFGSACSQRGVTKTPDVATKHRSRKSPHSSTILVPGYALGKSLIVDPVCNQGYQETTGQYVSDFRNFRLICRLFLFY